MSRLVLAGDVRLDNRRELLSALGPAAVQTEIPTDADLVLRAYERWGDACPARLLGDFAFVIRDRETGGVFGARDAFGVKPFYYRASPDGFGFGLSAEAVAEDDGLPLEIEEARIADALVPQLEAADRTSTFYRGVLRLPPACRVVVQDGRTKTSAYWSPDAHREIRFADDREYVEAFRGLFETAVRTRLSASTGVMLSGGLDSSAIVGVARRIRLDDGGPPLTTISALTEVPSCEESRCIRAVLALPGLDPVTIRPADLPSFRAEIDALGDSAGTPFDAFMVIPFVAYAAARRRGLDVVLDGIDGDCVASHEPNYLESLMRAGAWRAAGREAAGLARFYRGTYAPWSSALQLYCASAARAFAPRSARRLWRRARKRRAIEEALSSSLIRRDFATRIGAADRLETLWAHRGPASGRSPRERQAVELTHPQIAAALERCHRVAASQGIEARHPFFDRPLVEYCLALPWDQKVRDGWSKFILRRSSEGLLPAEVRWRRGRWVRLGPSFLATAIAAERTALTRAVAAGLGEIEEYVDAAKVELALDRWTRAGDPEAAESLWLAWRLSLWLHRNASRRYDLPARPTGATRVTGSRATV